MPHLDTPDVRLGISSSCAALGDLAPSVSGDIWRLTYIPISGNCRSVDLDIVAFVLSGRPGLRAFEVKTERSQLLEFLTLAGSPFPDANDTIMVDVLVTEDGVRLGNAAPEFVDSGRCKFLGTNLTAALGDPSDPVVYQLECAQWVTSVFPDGAEWRSALAKAGKLEADAQRENPIRDAIEDAGEAFGEGGAGLLSLLFGAAVLGTAIAVLSRRKSG